MLHLKEKFVKKLKNLKSKKKFGHFLKESDTIWVGGFYFEEEIQ